MRCWRERGWGHNPVEPSGDWTATCWTNLSTKGIPKFWVYLFLVMPQRVQSHFRRHQCCWFGHPGARIKPQTPMMSSGYMGSWGWSTNPFCFINSLLLHWTLWTFHLLKKPRKTTRPPDDLDTLHKLQWDRGVTQLEPALCSAFPTTAFLSLGLFFLLFFLNYYFHS